MFASASLDRTVKVWSIDRPAPMFRLEGHENSVNATSWAATGRTWCQAPTTSLQGAHLYMDR
jgi:WD40 repeat protein